MSGLVTLDPLPAGISLLGTYDLDRLRVLYPNVIPPKGMPMRPRDCPTCRGRKKFPWWKDDERLETAVYQCNCIDQWKLHVYFLNANIGRGFQTLAWPDVEVELGAVHAVKEYQEKSESYVQAGFGLILYGEMGTGKTMLATLLLKKLLALGHGGYFITFEEMIKRLTDGWHNHDDKEWFRRRIENAGVLVIDDIGREWQRTKQSGLSESMFDNVLRHRVASALPTIITTNLDMTKMREGYGGNIWSLLHERSVTHEFTGASYRDQHRQRLDSETARGLIRPIVVE